MYIPYHILRDPSYAFMVLTYSYACSRCNEGITLVELDAEPQEENQEVQHLEVSGEGEPKADRLPECPDHQPSTFVKGKPQSIISLPILLMSLKVIHIAALCDRSCLETIAAYNLP